MARLPKGWNMADNAEQVTAKQVTVARLVVDHHATLYRYAFRLTGSADDAEDLTQQTFLAAQQNLNQLRELAFARAWLFTILRNCYLKSLRRRLPMSAAALDLNIDDLPEDAPQPVEIDRERLQGALDELSSEFKVVVLMFYFEGRSYREIAGQLNLPLGTVMSRLSRAKSHLRGRLFEAEFEEAATRSRAATHQGR
jgi:RNA polymerase sigma-70 factor (ECF subfamily)